MVKKVSVIVPVYNSEKFLHKCLDSLVNQTIKEIEIILIDDGSTDSSLDIIKTYSQRYPTKIKYESKTNGGQGIARNLGIDLSSAEYIGFLDSDDYVDINMFEKMYNIAESKNADYVECDYKYLNEIEDDQQVLTKYCKIKKRKNKRALFFDPLVSPWNKIYRADIIKRNSITFTEGHIYEDTAFYLKAIPFIQKIEYINDEFVRHLFWPTSTMNINREKKISDIFRVLEDAIDFYRTNNIINDYYDELEYFCTKILLFSSLGRIVKIKDDRIREQISSETLNFLSKYFPTYKTNVYLKKSFKGIYVKLLNSRNILFYGRLYTSIKTIVEKIN